METASIWNLSPFNTMFFILCALFGGILWTAARVLRKKEEDVRARVLAGACFVTLAAFFLYKYALSADPDFSRLRAHMGGFSWWNELPLHLCNINMILIPAAVLKRNRTLMSFCFFVGPIGAAMALIMPGPEFSNAPFYLPRMLGFYGTHFMIVIEALSLGTLGFYVPKKEDIPKTIAAFPAIGFAVFLFNVLLRSTGLYDRANYFYTMETEGNGLLEIFWKLIPVPFLYLLPSVAILAAYMYAVTFLYERMKGKTV